MIRAGRVVLLLLLARWTFLFLAWPMRSDTIGASLPHLVSIPFHEAGHIVFAPFGDLTTSLGGSLMQVLVPIICAIACLTPKRFKPFGAALMCWWAGQNLSDVAMHIGEARALNLVLLGGYTGAEVQSHDWVHILSTRGWYDRDVQIARAVHLSGAVLMIGALVWGAVLVFRRNRTAKDD